MSPDDDDICMYVCMYMQMLCRIDTKIRGEMVELISYGVFFI